MNKPKSRVSIEDFCLCRDGSGSPHLGQYGAFFATKFLHSTQETRVMISFISYRTSIITFPHGNVMMPLKYIFITCVVFKYIINNIN